MVSKTLVNLLFVLPRYVSQEAEIFHDMHVTTVKKQSVLISLSLPLPGVWKLPMSGQNEKSSVNSRLPLLHEAQR